MGWKGEDEQYSSIQTSKEKPVARIEEPLARGKIQLSIGLNALTAVFLMVLLVLWLSTFLEGQRPMQEAVGIIYLFTGLLLPVFTHIQRCLRSLRLGRKVKSRYKSFQSAATLALILWSLPTIAKYNYITYEKKELVEKSILSARTIVDAAKEHYTENGYFPSSNKKAGVAEPTEYSKDPVDSAEIKEDGTIVIKYKHRFELGSTIILTPTIADNRIVYSCTGGDVKPYLRPTNCNELLSREIPNLCRKVK